MKMSSNTSPGRRQHDPMPPIGVFWDIENCQIPRNKSAIDIVQKIRAKLFKGHREAEFMCVCDINKESKSIIEELNRAQVNVIHVNATSKNAADDKLRQCLRRYGITHHSPATVVLLSGDVNFATELSDLRHRHNFNIILIYKGSVSTALLSFAHQHFSFDDLLSDIAVKVSTPHIKVEGNYEILISNIPHEVSILSIKNRLKQLSDNCGGRIKLLKGSTAVLKFPTVQLAQRAQKRMDKENVFGNEIKVEFPNSPLKDTKESSLVRRLTYSDQSSSNSSKSSPTSSPPHSKIQKKIPVPAAGGSPDRKTSDKLNTKCNNLSLSPESNTGERLESLLNKLSDACNRNVKSTTNCANKGYLTIQQQKYQKQQQGVLNQTTDLLKSTTMATQKSSYMNNASTNDISSSPSTVTSSVRSTPAPSKAFSGQFSPANVFDNVYRIDRNVFKPVGIGSDVSNNLSRPILSPSGCLNHFNCAMTPPPEPAYLLVSNLDFNISAKEWKKIIYSTFQQNIAVLSVDIRSQSDGSNAAIVTVPSEDEARYAISQYHRMKIGYKRLSVTLISDGNKQNNLGAEVFALLKNITGQQLPVYKLRELYEKRYNKNLTNLDMCKLRDICDFTDNNEIAGQCGSGRYIQLKAGITNNDKCSESEINEIMSETAYCALHCPPDSVTYMETCQLSILPPVRVQLKHLAMQVHTLLQLHTGEMPLQSFLCCYKDEFKRDIEVCNEGGVPLEHLLTCIPGVQFTMSKTGIKMVQWAENKMEDASIKMPVNPNLAQFAREVVDLLKQQSQSRLHSSRFIPTYHHHFGRQCRVADYGYTKLSELLDAVPHVLQVMGHRTVLTLTHRSQVRRFTSDITRLLRAQTDKQIAITDIPEAFIKLTNKPWDITEYGVCYIEDMLSEVPDTAVVFCELDNEIIIMIPRRDQTPEEIERTKQFGLETIELLKHSPQCCIPFNKFIPAYHHHFGKQCRVSDYGFMKLIDLFEAVPDVLKIADEDDEKIICLTDKELFKVLEDQVDTLIKSTPGHQIALTQFMTAFLHCHGHALCLTNYHVNSVIELVESIPKVLKLVNIASQLYIQPADRIMLSKRSKFIFMSLMDSSRGAMDVADLRQKFCKEFVEPKNFEEAIRDLQDLIEEIGCEDSKVIKLSPLHMFGREVCLLLEKNQSRLPLQSFESAYFRYFGVELKPAQYGYPTLVSLLQGIEYIASIRGTSYRKTVLYHKDFLNRIALPVLRNKVQTIPSLMSVQIPWHHLSERQTDRQTPSTDSAISELKDEDNQEEMIQLTGSMSTLYMSILDEGLPSAIPSPDIKPILSYCDLLSTDNSLDTPKYNFDKPSLVDELIGLSHMEKLGQKTPLCRTPVSQLLQMAAEHLPEIPAVVETTEQSRLENTMAWVYSHQQDTCTRQCTNNSNNNTRQLQATEAFQMAVVNLPQVTKNDSSFATPMKTSVKEEETTPTPKIPGSKEDMSPATAMIISLVESVLVSPRDKPLAISSPANTSCRKTNTHKMSEEEVKSSTSPAVAVAVAVAVASAAATPSPRKCRIAARFSVPIESPCDH